MAICLCVVRSASSQEVSVEIVGADTFPLVSVYHGIPVVLFTDSQMTTIAELVEMNNFLVSEVVVYQQQATQYGNIIEQKDFQIDTMQAKIKVALKVLALERQNEVDLKNNLSDAAKKYRTLEVQGRMKLTIGVIGGFIVGTGFGVVTGILIKK